MGSWVGGDFFCTIKVETKNLVFISKTKVETPREKRSIPQTNQDKRSCPHNDRFHIQSVNLIDTTLVITKDLKQLFKKHGQLSNTTLV